jgi:porin
MAALLAGFLGAPPARAQNTNSGVGLGPSTEVNRPGTPPPAPAGGTPPVEHLFGDWGGLLTRLDDAGVDVTLDFTSEFAGNVSGGIKQGSTFANQLGLETDIDWQKLAGLMGLSTHVIVVNRSGSSDSALFGDTVLPVQEIYGSGGDVAVHLVSTYAEQKLLGGALNVAAGRMNVENDFASSPLYCNFMNNGLCGDPKALPGGDIGHSAYPEAVWALRVRARPQKPFYIQIGVYEVNRGLYSDVNDRTGWKFDTSQDSGIYVPIEAAWEPMLGPANMPGHYKVGFGYDSSPFGQFTVSEAVSER